MPLSAIYDASWAIQCRNVGSSSLIWTLIRADLDIHSISLNTLGAYIYFIRSRERKWLACVIRSRMLCLLFLVALGLSVITLLHPCCATLEMNNSAMTRINACLQSMLISDDLWWCHDFQYRDRTLTRGVHHNNLSPHGQKFTIMNTQQCTMKQFH